MRICATQGIFAFLLCGVSMASPGYSQLLDQEVTVSISNVSFEKALLALGTAAHVKFAYSLDQLEVTENVSIDAHRTTLRKVLDELLTPYHIRYKVHADESTILLKRQIERPQDQSSAPKEYSSFAWQAIAGTVRDIHGQPMAGVNVVVKGSTNGTTTDAEGRFNMNANAGDMIVFSFIGYATVEVLFNGQENLEVILAEDIRSLSEVVVNAGYWEVKERENTGSISRLTAEQIAAQPVSNFLQAMQGRMTGVYISQVSGVPGSNFRVQIRGRNSIAAGNDPLYIIDGIPYPSGTLSSTFTTGTLFGSSGSNPLSTLSPENIESIEVLKDADATAIYGSRGANGVVLITTRKAVEGKSKLVINVNKGISSVTRKMDLMNTRQYVSMRQEGFANDQITPTPNSAPDLLLWDTTRYTDWQEELLGGTASFTNLSAMLSGGSRSTRYVFNNAYQNQGTVFPGDARYLRGTSHLSVRHTAPDDRFTAAFDVSYNKEKNSIQPIDLTATAISLAPNAPALYGDDGNLNWENSTWTNPLSHLNKSFVSLTANLIASADVGYRISDAIDIKSRFSYNDLRLKEKALTPSTFFDPVYKATAQYASSTFNTNSVLSWIWEPQLTFKKEFDRIQLNLTGGATLQNTDREQLIQYGTNFASDALLDDINAAGTVDVVGYTKSEYRYAAVFGRVNTIMDGKYILNLTARRDGSSRFGPGKRFANFMAAGAAWIFTKEAFVTDNLGWLSFGKLRASYGTTGNDQIGDYGYLDTYQSTSAYNGTASLVPTQLFNPDYAWEINRKFEAALDLGFLDDRISLRSNYYLNRSSNQLVGYPLPLTTGFASIQSNLGATVQNTGWEFELSSRNISRNSFSWNTDVTLTVPRNKLVSFPDLEISTYATRYAVGEPLSISKRYQYLGVNPQTGIYRFEDLNGDGSITSADRTKVVNIGVQYYGGVNNSLSYQNFQLEIFFQFVKQTGYTYPSLMFTQPGGRSQQPAQVLDNHWQQAGDEASIQKFSTADYDVYDAQDQYADSDQTIGDASFIRFKNISLSYTLPKSWLKSLECRLYFQAQNVFTITRYYGLDPESMSTSLPALRTVTAGLQLTF